MADTNYLEIAGERLAETGFLYRDLASIVETQTIGAVYEGERRVRWSSTANIFDAEHIVFAILPYNNPIDDPSMQVRLAAQEVALGEEYAVVGIEAYNSRLGPLTPDQRRDVRKGSFLPFADKVLDVMERTVGEKADTAVTLYGYSMGADVAAEVARDNLLHRHRGIHEINYLGAYEPARTVNRGSKTLSRAKASGEAFAESGADLWDNVISSQSPALLEARDITDTGSKGEKRHDKQVKRAVMKGIRADFWGSVAIAAGFGHDTTLHQLRELYGSPEHAPLVTVGRMGRSTMMPEDFRDILNVQGFGWRIHEHEAFDHSAADNLQNSAAFILETVRAAA